MRLTPEAGGEHLERARALAPAIAAGADEAERKRRLPPPLLAALADAGLTRMLLPRALGGGEVDPVTFVRVIEEIAKHDGSTAWVLCQISGCSMAAAYLEPAVAARVFGDPRAILAWGSGPAGRAVAVDGGYRVSGSWGFASGGRHATWFGAHTPVFEPDGATPRRRRDGGQEVRTVLFPASRATLVDVWNVIGLRGTGSDTYAVTDLFVPAEETLVRDDPAERRLPRPLYCFRTGSMYASGFAGVALGLARAMLDALVALDKTPKGLKQSLRDTPLVQAQVAVAEARLESSRTFLLTSLAAIWEAVGAAGAELTMEQRVRIRLSSTYAIQQAREVADAVYQMAGSSAIFVGGPFERRFRDVHAVTQQIQGRPAHFEQVGRFLLGLEPDTTFL